MKKKKAKKKVAKKAVKKSAKKATKEVTPKKKKAKSLKKKKVTRSKFSKLKKEGAPENKMVGRRVVGANPALDAPYIETNHKNYTNVLCTDDKDLDTIEMFDDENDEGDIYE